jgi:hypothetical protein
MSVNDDLITNFHAYLWDLATEAPFRLRQHPDYPLIEAPATFLVSFLRSIGEAVPFPPITRHGMDAALDQLFAHPALRPLLLDDATSGALQEHFATSYLPTMPPVFQAHWNHIIRPAWDQHRELQRTIRETEAQEPS